MSETRYSPTRSFLLPRAGGAKKVPRNAQSNPATPPPIPTRNNSQVGTVSEASSTQPPANAKTSANFATASRNRRALDRPSSPIPPG